MFSMSKQPTRGLIVDCNDFILRIMPAIAGNDSRLHSVQQRGISRHGTHP